MPPFNPLYFASVIFLWLPLSFQYQDTGSEPEVNLSGVLAFNEGEILDLEVNAHFCEFTEITSAAFCDYNATEKTVRLESVHNQPQFLGISNIKNLLLYPVCIPTLIIKNASYVTNMDYESRKPTRCFSSVEFLESGIDRLSHATNYAYTRNCTVQTIEMHDQGRVLFTLSNIKHLKWLNLLDPSKIAHSNISLISHLSIEAKLTIGNSSIDSIGPNAIQLVKDAQLNLKDSSIKSIGVHAISDVGDEGRIHLKNVVIQNAKYFFLHLNLDTKLLMENVQIIHAESPCFYIPISENVQFKNVTVEGEPLSINSKWISKFEVHLTNQNITQDMEECVKSGQLLECNFSDISKTIDLQLYALDGISDIIMKNGNNLILKIPSCTLNSLTILHSGIHQLTDQLKSNATSCNSKLYIRNSTVDSLTISAFTHLDILTSTVAHMEVENLLEFGFDSSVLKNIATLATQRASNGTMKNCSVPILSKVELNGPIIIDKCIIKAVNGMTLNHPNSTSTIRKTFLENIQRRGITVVAGHLELAEVSISYAAHESIYLTEEATVSLNNYGRPSYNKRFISLANENQISFTGSTNAYENLLFLLRRNESLTSIENHYESNIVVNTTTLQQLPCLTSDFTIFRMLSCNFQNFTDIPVIIDPSYDYPLHVTLSSVYFLVFPMHSDKLILLQNISNGTVTGEEINFSSLTLHNSNFLEVNSGTGYLTVSNTSIELLSSPSSVISIFIISSNIARIEELSIFSKIDVIYSRIKIVEEIVASGNFTLRNVHIDLVKSLGITLIDAFSNIVGSEIGSVEEQGITIHGKLLIKNTKFRNLKEGALCVLGELVLENVQIEQGSISSFNLQETGSMKFTNVTMNNKLIAVEQRIYYVLKNDTKPELQTTSEVKTNHATTSITKPLSVKGNQTITKTLQPSPKVNQTMTTTPTPWPKSKEKGSSRNATETSFVKEFGPNKNSTSEGLQNLPENSTSSHHIHFTPQNSLHFLKHSNESMFLETTSDDNLSWIALILGFFLGSGIAVLVLYTIFIFRPKKLLLPPPLHWRVREDQQDLVSSDEEEMREIPPNPFGI